MQVTRLVATLLVLIEIVACGEPATSTAPTVPPTRTALPPPSATPRSPATTTAPVPTRAPTSAPTLTNTPASRPTLPPTFAPTQIPPTLSVDQLLVQCPTAQQVVAINARLKLSFESDPTVDKLICTASSGSADLTLLQRRVYQTLEVMQRLQFSKPLPWTDQSLYDWFASTIKGIRLRSDIEFSNCCNPKDTINVRIANNVYLLLTDRWVEPQRGGGLMDSVVLYVHEARHNQGYGHTCGTNDKTIAELGAWGVQYYLDTWLADYSDPNFISDPYYRRAAIANAEDIRKTRFCNEPK